ncbi:hypothetical protein D3C72_2478580 [compost metagenome]
MPSRKSPACAARLAQASRSSGAKTVCSGAQGAGGRKAEGIVDMPGADRLKTATIARAALPYAAILSIK